MGKLIKKLCGLTVVAALVLSMMPVFELPVFAAEDDTQEQVRFPSGVESYSAYCPVCNATATWKPYHGENNSDSPLNAASHLYLEEDTTYKSGKTFLVAYRRVCFNLNGYDLTAEPGASYAFACAGTTSFIDTYGGSVVTGGGTVSGGSATIHANSPSVQYNLYAGTWKKSDYVDGTYLIHMSTKGGVINVYDGAVIDAGGSNTGGVLLVRGSYATSGTQQKATFNMYGGELKNGRIKLGGSGDTYTGCAYFNMYGGTIANSEIRVTNEAAFAMSGGTITDAITTETGTKITLSGDPQIQGGLSLGEGVTANIANLTKDAKIVIGAAADNCALTTAREDAAALRNVFTSADDAKILLGKDDAFYRFSTGMAILDSQNKATLYPTAEEAVAAYYAEDGFLKGEVLLSGAENQTITLAGDAYIDAAGWDLNVAGTGKLYGIDSSNDTYASCAKWTLGENVTVQADVTSPTTGNRYLFADGGYHRIALAITQVVLRAAENPGMYYKARIACDEVLAKLITGYGVALSLEDMPGADFAQQEDVRYTAYDRETFAAQYADHQVTATSCILVGVLKPENSKQNNTINIKRNVYANLYANVNLNGQSLTLMADEGNAGKTTLDKDFDGVAASMLQLLVGISNHWSKYSVSQKSAIRNFVAKWDDHVNENTFPVLRNDIQVGFGRVDITPSYSVPLAGYGQTHKRMSTGVAERIYATCVAITEESGNTLLLISQDLIDSTWAIPAQEAISAATGVPTENIMVAGTHTHAAPDIRSSLDVIQKDYKQDYLVWVTEAAVAAMADRSPAVAYTSETTLQKMNSVRHYLMADGTYAGDNFGSFTNSTIVEPAEQADKQLQVIKFAREGKQNVVMSNWQAHVTYGTSSTSTLISSCFVGIARDHFEENTGDLFAYFTGACGNTNCVSKIGNQNRFSNYTQYSEILSQEIINLTKTMDESHIADFAVKSVSVKAYYNHEMEDRLEDAKAVTAIYNAQGLSAGTKEAKKYGFSSVYHAQAIVRRSSLGVSNTIPLTAFYLGDISFIAAPYEMFAAHGMQIKESSEKMTFVITSCNGRYGYMPTNKAYDYGCYESHSANYARGTGDLLANAFMDMLDELEGGLIAEKEQLSLRYDDRYDVSGKTVSILDAGTPTSYKVGTNEKDTAVITIDGDNLIATGIGTAQVKIDNTIYNITVEAAPISLVMITGHSIGAGQNGDPNYSVVGPAGQVYSSHGTTNLGATTDGVGIGYGAAVKAANINAFTEAGTGTKGEGSGLAWQWNNLTGEKIWVLNTAVGGSCLPEWIPGETYYENAVTQFQRAQAILANEIKAGHYTLSQMGIIYHNGANFSYKGVVATQSDYETWYEAMWNGFKTETSRDMDADGKSEAVSFLGLVPIWTMSGGISYSSDEPAGLYMAASKDYPEIFTASLIGQNWLTDASVAEKFPEINYTTQAGSNYTQPNLTTDVFASDNVHYQQVAYNALGIDIANNLYVWLKGEDKSPELAMYKGSRMLDIDGTLELTVGDTWVLSPVTNLNDLTFTVSGCIELKYPLQVVATGEGTGTLTISNGSFTKEITFVCKNPSDEP